MTQRVTFNITFNGSFLNLFREYPPETKEYEIADDCYFAALSFAQELLGYEPTSLEKLDYDYIIE